MKKYRVLFIAIVIIFSVTHSYAQTFNYSLDRIKSTLTILAGDDMRGREAGSKEDRLSADFISDQLYAIGFTPMVGENPLVPFPLTLYRETGFGSKLSVADKRFIEGVDFFVSPQSPSVNSTSMLKAKYDTTSSYNGAVVMVSTTTDSIPFISSALKQKGASAMIAYTGEDLFSSRRGGTITYSIPVIYITKKIHDELNNRIDSQVSYNTVTHTVYGQSYNVIMRWGSAQPHYRVLIGAHHDHLGMGGAGSGSMRPNEIAVHNGADDNASGVSAAIEIGRLLSNSVDSLKVEVVVASFGAEERGLIGSKFLVDTLKSLGLLPNLMINLDMVGRMSENKLQVGGVGTFKGAEELIKGVKEGEGLNLTFTQDGYGPSDHSSFYKEEVPVLYFTTGVHQEYHTPADKIDLINFKGIGEISSFVASITDRVINGDPIEYIKMEAPTTNARSSFNVTLGLIPDFTYEKGDGFRVGSVSQGRAAAKGGLLQGDIIKKMDGIEISNIYDYMESLSKLKKGELLKLEIDRDGEIILLTIEL